MCVESVRSDEMRSLLVAIKIALMPRSSDLDPCAFGRAANMRQHSAVYVHMRQYLGRVLLRCLTCVVR